MPQDPVAIARHTAKLVMLYVLGMAVLTQVLYYLPRYVGAVGTYLIAGGLLVVASFVWAWWSPRQWPEDHRSDGQREIDGQVDALVRAGLDPEDALARVRARIERAFPSPRDGQSDSGLPPGLAEAMRNGGAVIEVGRHRNAEEQREQADLPAAGRPYL